MNLRGLALHAKGLLPPRDRAKSDRLGDFVTASLPLRLDDLHAGFLLDWEDGDTQGLLTLDIISPEGGAIANIHELLDAPSAQRITVHSYQMPPLVIHTAGWHTLRAIIGSAGMSRRFQVHLDDV